MSDWSRRGRATNMSDLCFSAKLHDEIAREAGDSAWAAGYEVGAGVAFGLIGMAEAIASAPYDFWLHNWRCIRCEHINTDDRAVWCEKCAPRRHAREVREGYPASTRGEWKESES